MPNYRAMARRAAQRHGLDPDIFERQIQQESGFQTGRTSGAGAQGIAQIMPATARGWGVDPNNPKQALNAAAKHMASYVKQFGNYDKALRAYNAGPGAVERSKGFSETNHYVATILGGKSAKARGTEGKGGGGTRTTTSITRNPVTPAVNVAAILAQRQTEQAQRPVTGPSLPESLTPKGYSPVVASTPSPAEAPATDLKAAIDKIAQDKLDGVTVKTKTTKTGGGGGGGAPAKGSEIKELIWAGPGSQFIDNGKFVAPYAADQHRDHVHVAAGPKTTDRLGRLAQSMGLNVGENPDFGGVDPVHTGGSFHYRDMAIDVSGDPAKMRRFAKRVAKYQKRRR